MDIDLLLKDIEEQAKTLVWWSPSQIARGDHLKNDADQGDRPWIIPETTGRFLHDFILEKKPTTILELGTSIGYSTIWLARAVNEYGGHIHTIEMKLEKITVAQKNIISAGLEKNVTFHLGTIASILESMPNDLMFDFVFMDADRGHYHEYLPLIEKHLAPHAVIIADNAKNMQDRMQRFIELLNKENWHYEIKDLDNGILIAHK